MSPRTRSSDPALILVGGPARSGTSLVAGLLGGHPSIHLIPTDWIVFDRLPMFQRWTGIDQPDTPERIESALRYILEESPAAKWGVTVPEAMEARDSDSYTWPLLAAHLVSCVRARHPDQIICLKKPTSESLVELISDSMELPQGGLRVVFVIRDPKSTWLSWKHRQDTWAVSESDSSLAQWSANWIEETSRFLELNFRDPSAVRLVRYEDVTKRPSEVARELCVWLGLPDLTSNMTSLEGFSANSSFSTADATNVAGRVVDPSTIEKPKLPEDEDEFLSRLCGYRARLFGYEGRARQPWHRWDTEFFEAALHLTPSRRLLSATRRTLLYRLRKRLGR